MVKAISHHNCFGIGYITTFRGRGLRVMEDAGHGFYDSHPDVFNKLAIDFLKNEQ